MEIRLTFATLVCHTQDAGNLGAEVAPLRDVPAPEAEAHHQLVEDPRDVDRVELPVQRWARRKCVPGHGWRDEVIWEGGGRVACAHDRQNGEELEEGPWIVLHISMVCRG